jgi:hypothetical protein
MTTRASFLSTGAVALAAAGTTSAAAATPSAPSTGGPAVTTSPFDFPAIAAQLARPAEHRQVFSAARVADGAVLSYMVNSLNAYEFDYGLGPNGLHAAAVCYHLCAMLLLDDAAWAKYPVAKALAGENDAVSSTETKKNPFLAPTSTLDPKDDRMDRKGFYHDTSLTALVRRGASFFACNNALTYQAREFSKLAGQSPDAVLADLHAHLVPGALLVPAGVAALNQAQEAKFTFLLAS